MTEIEQAFAAKTEENAKALGEAVKEMRKKYGAGAVMQLGTDEPIVRDQIVIPTGSLALDIALGIGGAPAGRIIEVFGPESSGKTTLALQITASAQAMGGVAAYIDAEHALDLDYARHLGVKTDEMLIAQPDSGEQSLEIAENLITTGGLAVVVVDSVAALTPQAEIDGEMGAAHVGLQARLMSQALRKLTSVVAKSGTLVIFINQIRMKIGVMFGSPETTTGGNALKFYASVRLDIRRIGSLKEGTKEDTTFTGSRTRVKVVKNKMAPPFREAEFDILYGTGISRAGDLLDLGINYGFVTKSGTWFALLTGQRLGQGRDNARDLLASNPDLMNWLDDEIRHHVKLPPRGPLPACMIPEPSAASEKDGAFDKAFEKGSRGKSKDTSKSVANAG